MKRPPSSTAKNTPDFPPPRPVNPRIKKSQKLPNFSDCNCCNRRIYSINAKNRVKILKSEWRIVLLCKNCYILVESSQFCTYCLTRVSSEFYECEKCRRRIHKNCASMFSYNSGNSCDDFSVCFDCWIPNLIENEFNRSRAGRCKIRKKQLGKNGVDRVSVANSVLCLEDVVIEANVAAEKKIATAVEMKEKAFRKIMAAKVATEVAGGAVGVVAMEEGGDDEDGQLAIRLHREMNSSSRVSRNECWLNSHCVDVPWVNGLESRGVNETSCSCWGTKVAMVANGMGIDDSSGVRRECGNGFNGDSRCVITYSRKGRVSKVVKCKEETDCHLKVYARKPSQVADLEARQCLPQLVNLEAARCFATYSRRQLHCKSVFVNSSLNLENGDRAPNMSINCREEPMSLTNAT